MPRRAHANGWSSNVQRAFIAALARTGVIAAAARGVGRTPRSAYQLRGREGTEGFARAWDMPFEEARLRAIDAVVERGFGPRRVAVWYRGRQVGWRDHYDNRLLFAALRAMDGMAGRIEARSNAPPTPRNNVTRPRNKIAGLP